MALLDHKVLAQALELQRCAGSGAEDFLSDVDVGPLLLSLDQMNEFSVARLDPLESRVDDEAAIAEVT